MSDFGQLAIKPDAKFKASQWVYILSAKWCGEVYVGPLRFYRKRSRRMAGK